MYIRSKVAKGHKYYQIVEGFREGGKIRQRVVVALGYTNDPAVALQRMRSRMRRLRAFTKRFPADYGKDNTGFKTIRAKIARCQAEIDRLEPRISTLENIVKKKLVVVPENQITGAKVMAYGQYFQTEEEYYRFMADPAKVAEATKIVRARMEGFEPHVCTKEEQSIKGTYEVVPTKKRKDR